MSAVMHVPDTWLARLELEYSNKGSRTVITHRKHQGPLTIQRPFYPEGDVCHTYLLHPPGGIVGGDELLLNIKVHNNAHALLTTPASTKFYRSNGQVASQKQVMHIGSRAILEWLPQETILFNAASCHTTTEVHLDKDARFAGWEILCQGRPASGDFFRQGACRQRLEIYRQGEPIILERARLTGSSEIQSAKWGLSGYSVMGTMLVTNCTQDILEQARSLTIDDSVLFSATLIRDVLICRYLGNQGIEAREYFARVWQVLREQWAGKPACMPRIWQT